MKLLNHHILGILLIAIVAVDSANILFYFGIAGHSHINSIWNVISKLADSGQHNVTLLTTFEPKLTNPRVKVVYAKEIYDTFLRDEWDEGSDLLGARMENKQMDLWNIIFPLGIQVCKTLLEGSATHDLVYNSKFDLVIFDTAINDCAMGLAHYVYKCPFIAYSAVALFPYYYDEYGLQVESSSYPEVHTAFKYPLSFYDKIVTTLEPLNWRFTKYYEYFPALNELFNKHFDLNGTASLSELTSKTSLVLRNSHYSNENPRSLPPIFVSVAGIGVNTNTKPLPKDLEAVASNPKTDGFIYVSFGTVVRISKSNLDLRNKFLRAFGKFPSIQFIWKWEGKDYPTGDDIPKNIHFSSWLPQQDLLAHKRIKGFITHGGANSVHEATHYGVPMIVFPVLGDQDYNANTLEARGLGLALEITKFTQEELENKIQQLLTDKEFQTKVKLASIAFKDRPMKPIDTAIWWIEYVLRTKDTSFLMPIAAKQTWYEKRVLDVWFTLFSISIILALTIIFILYKFFSIFFYTKTKVHVNGFTNGHTTTNGYKSKVN